MIVRSMNTHAQSPAGVFTLGIHGGTNTAARILLPTPRNWLHDSAAVLCKDGEVVAAAEEERFTRIKHVSHFPVESIRYCLTSQGIGLGDVAWLVLSSEHMNDFLQMENRWRHGTRWWLEPKGFVPFASRLLKREFGVETAGKWLIAGHHHSHALSAIYHAGFQECLCVVLDGRGDRVTGLVASFEGGALTVLRILRDLGPAAMYLRCTEALGFSQFDEYKVMGLAAYDPATDIDDDVDRLVELGDDGTFKISLPAVFKLAFVSGALRRPGTPIEAQHIRFAAVVQRAAERAVCHLVRHFRSATGHRYLCLAGGLAQNCSINGKLLASGVFDDVFVQPASYDAGCAIGAAMHGYFHAGGHLEPTRIRHVYWGCETPVRSGVEDLKRSWSAVVDIHAPDDICAAAARLLAEGRVIGWMQGRAEFGARALGNRSILADPRPASNKDRINALIKRREAFRPFAPSVLEEHLHECFEVPASVKTLPFMVFVVPVRPAWRPILGAVTHVDGSARPQSVSKHANPCYWQLIEAFRQITGVPLLLNTSFNSESEPIVNTPREALNCFLATGLDDLVIGDYLVSRRFPVGDRTVIAALVPRLANRFALTRWADGQGRIEAAIQDRYTNEPIPASVEARECLERAIIEDQSLGHALNAQRLTAEAGERVLDELSQLWQRRVFLADRAVPFGRLPTSATAD
jgi:carbamoyltransferase